MDLDFFEKVYKIVEKIPCGKVTSYGAIAQCLGMKSSARMVGYALANAANRQDLPCHRVVNRMGLLSGKHNFASPFMMKELLLAEGIEFIDEAVDMKQHFWDPNEAV